MINDLEIYIQENINDKTRRFGVFLTPFSSRYSTGKLSIIDTLSDDWLKHFYIRHRAKTNQFRENCIIFPDNFLYIALQEHFVGE